MTERELQEAVARMCRDLGLFHKHDPDSRWNRDSGWPDSFIMNQRTGRVMFRELKTQSGTLSREQKIMGYALSAGGHDWRVWRPADLLDGTVAAQLCALAGVRQRPRQGTDTHREHE